MILLKPTIKCNMNCVYCYEEKYRQSMEEISPDITAMVKYIKDVPKDREIVLHGGEPLLIGKRNVEKILKAIFNKKGHSSIQTNGLLIDDEYEQIFKEYKTAVGVSMDGIGHLNDYRTDIVNTSRLFKRLLSMKKTGLNVSLLSVVHQCNAGDREKLDQLKDFILDITEHKITGRINPCYDDGRCMLPMDRMIEVYRELMFFVLEYGLRWSPFTDMIKAVRGEKDIVCIFSECDIFSTHSATVMLGDGTITNCMRVSGKDVFDRYPSESKVRSEILTQVEQSDYGCKDCEYWEYCYGGCPTQGVNGDWRNRTQLCPLYKVLFKIAKNITGYAIKYDSSQKCSTEKKQNEHIDGNIRHLDSPHADSQGSQHNYSDGIEHIDGTTRHLDGF